MSGLEAFASDKHIETEGSWCDYGTFRVLLARAGGSNQRYIKALQKAAKQLGVHQNNIEANRAVERSLMADYLILGWQTKVNGEWVDGIEHSASVKHLAAGPNGLISSTRENFKAVLESLNDLSMALQNFASVHTNYQNEENEELAGN